MLTISLFKFAYRVLAFSATTFLRITQHAHLKTFAIFLLTPWLLAPAASHMGCFDLFAVFEIAFFLFCFLYSKFWLKGLWISVFYGFSYWSYLIDIYLIIHASFAIAISIAKSAIDEAFTIHLETFTIFTVAYHILITFLFNNRQFFFYFHLFFQGFFPKATGLAGATWCDSLFWIKSLKIWINISISFLLFG